MYYFSPMYYPRKENNLEGWNLSDRPFAECSWASRGKTINHQITARKCSIKRKMQQARRYCIDVLLISTHSKQRRIVSTFIRNIFLLIFRANFWWAVQNIPQVSYQTLQGWGAAAIQPCRHGKICQQVHPWIVRPCLVSSQEWGKTTAFQEKTWNTETASCGTASSAVLL